MDGQSGSIVTNVEEFYDDFSNTFDSDKYIKADNTEHAVFGNKVFSGSFRMIVNQVKLMENLDRIRRDQERVRTILMQ